MTAVVVAERCSKWYGHVLGISDLSWRLPPGIVGLLGPNGAGKSTLMKLMAGLIQPSRGSLTVFGESPFRSTEVRRRIGLAAQDATVDPLLTGFENLVMISELHQLSRRDAKARASELLEEFSLADIRCDQVNERRCGREAGDEEERAE